MNPAEILEERISDAALKKSNHTAQIVLALDILAIAVPALMRAAHAGNVQCQVALEQITPNLNKLCPPIPKTLPNATLDVSL